MDILIPYSWLKDYLKTDLTPQEFARVISLNGPSIEKWQPTQDGDVVFDVEVTTNRTDAYSVYGLAREAQAILAYNDIKSELLDLKLAQPINGSGVNLELYPDVDETLCPRFSAIILDNVTIKKSPKFIQDRLLKVGERSLNNVVDVTNYVMYELGQPMHVFDYDKIAGHKMTLRASRAGENVTTLDGIERMLPEGAIVIEDAEKLIDLAGIMGGENSAIDETTQRVVLFAQTYNPHVIRKTSMQMAHRSEASSRFEKGLDTEAVIPALERGLALLQEYAEARMASDMIDIYRKPYQPKVVAVTQEQIDRLVGVPLPIDKAAKILDLLGFDVTFEENALEAIVPSYRADDIDNAYDLIEEIARMYGYHNIPSLMPTGPIPSRPDNMLNKRIKQAKTAMKFFGFTELFTNSATSKDNIVKLYTPVIADPPAPSEPWPSGDPESRSNPWPAFDHGKDSGTASKMTSEEKILVNVVRIKNPLTEDFTYMRPNLLTTMLPVVAENLPRFPELQVFELSKIYRPQKSGLPNEIRILEAVQTGTNLLQMKGSIESVLKEVGVGNIRTSIADEDTIFEPGTHGIFYSGKKEIGHIGTLSHEIASRYGITTPLTIARLFFDEVITTSSDAVAFKPIPKYPALIEDISFIVDKGTPVGPIIAELTNLDKLISSVNLVDIYIGDRVGESKKSITLRISYQSDKKLLSDADIISIRQRVIKTTTDQFQASVRS